MMSRLIRIKLVKSRGTYVGLDTGSWKTSSFIDFTPISTQVLQKSVRLMILLITYTFIEFFWVLNQSNNHSLGIPIVYRLTMRKTCLPPMICLYVNFSPRGDTLGETMYYGFAHYSIESLNITYEDAIYRCVACYPFEILLGLVPPTWICTIIKWISPATTLSLIWHSLPHQ